MENPYYILFNSPDSGLTNISIPNLSLSQGDVIATTVPAGEPYKIVPGYPPEYDPTIYQLVMTPEGDPEPHVIQPIPITESQQTYVDSTQQDMLGVLQPTDWLVIRLAETGIPIPTDWETWRNTVRADGQAMIDAIRATTDAAELDAYVSSGGYLSWPPEPTTPLY